MFTYNIDFQFPFPILLYGEIERCRLAINMVEGAQGKNESTILAFLQSFWWKIDWFILCHFTARVKKSQLT